MTRWMLSGVIAIAWITLLLTDRVPAPIGLVVAMAPPRK